MKQTTAVFLGEDPVEVGTLACEARGHRRSVSFAYGDRWLENPDSAKSLAQTNQLAAAAGINAAKARVVESEGIPVAVITRFDRANGKRLMYLSAHSLMEAAPTEQHTYVDMADTIRMHSSQAAIDLNPVPDKEGARTENLDFRRGPHTASLAEAIAVAPLFGLTQNTAAVLLDEVKSAFSPRPYCVRSYKNSSEKCGLM